MHYIFVINGRKDYSHIEGKLKKQLEGLSIQYTLYTTTGVGDATRFTRLYCDLHGNEEVCFVACGGSGITNEVASGIVGKNNKSMAILAYGLTNDLLKMYPEYDFTSVRKMLEGTTRKIDIIKVNDSYALNTCNFGFDSTVADEVSYLTENNKRFPYQRGIIRALLSARYNRIKIIADGKPLNKWLMLSCAIGNGRYVANKYLCTPKAEVDDGLMDICLLKIMSFLRFVLFLPHYQKGEQIEPKYSRKVIYTQAKHVDVISKELFVMVLDGELLPGTEFSIDILPQAIQLRLPKH
jgi:diacylglycerol kinase (ATP)